MSIPKYIWLKKKNKRLYLYDTYSTWDEAKKVAKRMQKRLKNNYMIFSYETFFSGKINYALYMNKTINIGSGLF